MTRPASRAQRPRRASRSREREGALAAAAAVRVPASCDVVVAGGGAAGLVAAIAAAEAGASVTVLERDATCGRPILATGNGRCNFMNEALLGPSPVWDRYNDPAFVAAVCGERVGEDVLAFFEGCGLAWASEEGRLYPLSRQASSVREVLLARAGRAGARLAPAREVLGARRGKDGWRVSFRGEAAPDGGEVEAAAVVLAAGGGSALGREAGLAVTPAEPVLCSLACAPEDGGVSLAGLDGRRARAVARLLRDGAEVARESGEVLFRAYGLSGIVVFDLSRVARAGDVIALDLLDGLGAPRAEALVRAAGGTFGLIDPLIAAALGANPLDTARDLRFIVSGPAEPKRAQVTRGGLATSQFLPATLEARERPGLFACGEALDVDAACGGYNLAWAWKSGLVAGRAAAERAGSRPEGPR
ncbi:NAD(P)/FAD-dependent oxidoreductase [Olsenella sp. An290]|uniref:NAD(P)/FAD-dependent oxidoreductase n=1 Tax=Olsenella sp. An290 TaxID=1965625 RepID=UPI001EF6E298|nr:NAD(P)/FAD-dependent oxidoreductase [Olsenella sp. An290]